MSTRMSRREFLKLGAASLGALAFNPYLQEPQLDTNMSNRLVRIATSKISVQSQANDQSTILMQRTKDEILNVYYDVVSESGPKWNPVWYRVWGGYIHRAHTQPVENRLNPVLSYISGEKQLTEVTVPYSQSMTYKKNDGWQRLYRLYYQSTHWIKDIIEGPDGEAWYQIMDESDPHNNVYAAPAAHLRPIPESELTPISPDIDQWSKRIEVSINNQTLTAYEGERVVLKADISSGLIAANVPGTVSTKTPTGTHHIESKMPSKHMGNGIMTDDIEAYELPGVPWCCFFFMDTGVAIHGTYWHTNYGNPMSHGCVNMRTEDAKWIYRWTIPLAKLDEREKRGYGTQVKVV